MHERMQDGDTFVLTCNEEIYVIDEVPFSEPEEFEIVWDSED